MLVYLNVFFYMMNEINLYLSIYIVNRKQPRGEQRGSEREYRRGECPQPREHEPSRGRRGHDRRYSERQRQYEGHRWGQFNRKPLGQRGRGATCP